MPVPWSFVETAIVLPIAEARAIFERAARFDIECGGRFDRRSACVLIWSTTAGIAASATVSTADSGAPLGAFWAQC